MLWAHFGEWSPGALLTRVWSCRMRRCGRILGGICDSNVPVQLDVLKIGFPKWTVGRDQVMLSHHFLVGTLQKFRCFIGAIAGCQSLAVAEENFFAGAFHHLHKPKLLVDI